MFNKKKKAMIASSVFENIFYTIWIDSCFPRCLSVFPINMGVVRVLVPCFQWFLIRISWHISQWVGFTIYPFVNSFYTFPICQNIHSTPVTAVTVQSTAGLLSVLINWFIAVECKLLINILAIYIYIHNGNTFINNK